jgi:hypothetical protein
VPWAIGAEHPVAEVFDQQNLIEIEGVDRRRGEPRRLSS